MDVIILSKMFLLAVSVILQSITKIFKVLLKELLIIKSNVHVGSCRHYYRSPFTSWSICIQLPYIWYYLSFTRDLMVMSLLWKQWCVYIQKVMYIFLASVLFTKCQMFIKEYVCMSLMEHSTYHNKLWISDGQGIEFLISIFLCRCHISIHINIYRNRTYM